MHVEMQETISSSGPGQGPKPRRWLPLVHAPANGAAPAAVVRLPPKLAHLPKRWAVGERVEVRLSDYCALKAYPSMIGHPKKPRFMPMRML